MADEWVNIGIPIGPVTVNISDLLKRLFNRKKTGLTDIVAKRFLSVFDAHGVIASQIPRLLPAVQLDALNSAETLLDALTNDVLDETANLFGIESEWLDGVSQRLYSTRYCYKRPQRLFDDLLTLKRNEDWFPIRALYSTKTLDRNAGRQQFIVLLLTEQIAELGEKEVLCFRVYGA